MKILLLMIKIKNFLFAVLFVFISELFCNRK